MTAERSSDPGRQRTVAELLQQYGGDGRSGGGGRRRRRSADEDDAAVGSTGSGLPVDPPSPASPHASETLSQYPSFGQPGLSGAGDGGLDWLSGGRSEWDRPSGVEDSYSALDRTGRVSDSYLTPDRPGSAGEDSFEWDRLSEREAQQDPLGGREAPPSGGTGGPGGTGGFPTQAYRGIYQGDSRQSGAFRAEPYQPEPYQPEAYQPEVKPAETTQAYRADPLAPPRRPERPTDRLPRYRSTEEEGPSTEVASRAALLDEDELEDTQGDGRPDDDDDEVESFRVQLGPEDTGQGLRRVREDRDDDLDDSDADDSDAEDEPDEAPPGRRSRRARAAEAEAPAGLTDEDDLDDPDDGRSPLVAWLILVGQGIVGAVLGGALWVGFRYLWLNFPVIALAGAVLATAGLVLVVRTIRGSDDIRTTMLAVLVGLIVTISPAVLLLTANG